MKYLIEEEEIIEIYNNGYAHGRGDIIQEPEDFIKTKKPLTEVASGTQEEVKKDFVNWITFKNSYKNLDIYIKESEGK